MNSRLLLTFALAILSLAIAPRSYADSSISGVISQTSIAQRTLAVKTGTATLSISVPPSAWITLDWIDCDLNNLRAGERVLATVVSSASGLTASRVTAQSSGPKKLARGTLQDFLLGFVGARILPDGSSSAVPTAALFDSATIIVRNNAPASVADLAAGDQISVLATVEPNGDLLANYVEATASASKTLVSASGFVKSVSGDQMIVKTWRDQTEMTLKISEGAALRRDDKATTLSGFDRGDQITAIGARNADGGMDAWLISALSPDTQLMGTISDLRASDGLIVIAPQAGGTPVSLRFLIPTILLVNGVDAELSDARIGDMALIRADTSASSLWTAVSVEIARSASGN